MAVLEKKLISITRSLGKYFTLKGRQISLEELFSVTGLLPGLAKSADQVASLCFGYGIGVSFEDEEQSLLGKRALFDEFTPDTLRIFCIMDALFELIKGNDKSGIVSCDELLYR